jgi:putative peptidoglycan lipid II flippase
MAAGTVTSRLLGFVRASLLAGVVGVGLAGDAFDVANSLPNQFYLLLAGGVLNAVLVPQITKAATHDDGGHEFVNRLLTLAITLMLGATVIVTAAAPLLVRLFSQGWSPETLGLATAFALICLPQVFFYGLYTLFGQVLNARGHFAAYMWAPALANIVAILGLLYLRGAFRPKTPVHQWTPQMIWVLGGTATLGVVVQAAVLLIPLHRSGFRFRPVWGFRGVGLRSASTVALWTFAAVGVSQLGFIVTSKVLTHANDLLVDADRSPLGKVAYSLAFLLFMLPHSLITVSLVTALFTRISEAAHRRDTAEVVADLGRGLRMPAVLLVPITAGAAVLGFPAVHVLFPGNTEAEARGIAQVMTAMMLGLVPFGWFYLVQRVYYAYENAKTPFHLQLVVTGVATATNLFATTVDPGRTAVVVGLGQSASNVVAALIGFWLLRRDLGTLGLRSTVRMYVRMAVASAVAALAAWAALWVLEPWLPGGRAGAVVELLVGGALFLALALGLARLMRVGEVTQLLDPVLRRVRRGA